MFSSSTSARAAAPGAIWTTETPPLELASAGGVRQTMLRVLRRLQACSGIDAILVTGAAGLRGPVVVALATCRQLPAVEGALGEAIVLERDPEWIEVEVISEEGTVLVVLATAPRLTEVLSTRDGAVSLARGLLGGDVVLDRKRVASQILEAAQRRLAGDDDAELGFSADGARKQLTDRLDDARDAVYHDAIRARLLMDDLLERAMSEAIRLADRLYHRPVASLAAVTQRDAELGRLVRSYLGATTPASRFRWIREVVLRVLLPYGGLSWAEPPGRRRLDLFSRGARWWTGFWLLPALVRGLTGQDQDSGDPLSPLVRFFGWLKPYRGYFAGTVGLAVFGTAVQIGLGLVASRALDAFTAGGQPPWTALVAVVSIAAAFLVLQAGTSLYDAYHAERMRYHVFFRFFELHFRLDQGFYAAHAVGDLIYRLTRELRSLLHTSVQLVHAYAGVAGSLLAAPIALWLVDWSIAWPILCGVLLHAGGQRWRAEALLALRPGITQRNARVLARMYELVENARLIRLFRAETRLERLLLVRFLELRERVARFATIHLGGEALELLFRRGPLGAAAVIGLAHATAGELGWGQVVLSLFLADLAVRPLNDLLGLGPDVFAALVHARRVTVVSDWEGRRRDGPEEGEPPLPFARLVLREVDAERDVDAPVLRGIDLELLRGEMVAVVGPSGAGKSTLLRVLAGEIEPSFGAISLHLDDGTRLEIDDPARLATISAAVWQEAGLAAGTVRDNLVRGRGRATDTELRRALKAADLGDWIRSFSGGLGGRIEEGGRNLSGGQRTRLVLARALLTKRPLLIVDELSAVVDERAEERILGALRAWRHDLTVIWITHRDVAVRRADRVLFLVEGRILGLGPHPKLLRQNAAYVRHMRPDADELPVPHFPPGFGRSLQSLDLAAAGQLIVKARRGGRLAVSPRLRGSSALKTLQGIGIATADGAAGYLPLASLDEPGVSLSEALDLLRPFLADVTVELCGFDLKPLLLLLWREGVPVRCRRFDVLLAGSLLRTSMQPVTIRQLCRHYLGLTWSPGWLTGGMRRNENRRAWKRWIFEPLAPGDPTKRRRRELYFGATARATFELRDLLAKALEEHRLARCFRDVEMPLIDVLVAMEAHGVGVSPPRLVSLRREFDRQRADRCARVKPYLRNPRWALDPRRLRQVLFGCLWLPVLERDFRGAPSLSATHLSRLAELCPALDDVVELRRVEAYQRVLRGLFYAVEGDDALHPTFHQGRSYLGRIPTRTPNLQGLPKRHASGLLLRQAIVPRPPNDRILEVDYSAFGMRILAGFSRDPELLRTFRENADIHTRTAQALFRVPEAEVDDDQRRIAKAINFGLLFGMGPVGLSRRVGIPLEVAADYIRRYFWHHQAVRRYLDGVIDEARTNGRVRTWLGRHLFLSGWKPTAHAEQESASAIRRALSFAVTGSSAEVMKVALLGVHRRLQAEGLRSRFILQIHDAMVFETNADEIGPLARLVEACMTAPGDGLFPLAVSFEVGPDFGSLEEVPREEVCG